MLLVVAALEEELKAGMRLCCGLESVSGGRLRRGTRDGRAVGFLRAGVGPEKAARNLAAALEKVRPERILVVGYAGALDPGLELGSLVAATRAIELTLDGTDWNRVRAGGAFELDDAHALVSAAAAAGIGATAGTVLTSPHVLGNPAHKEILFRSFHASIVDMETAALARVAACAGVRLGCIRAVSDEARDTFLQPFAFDPSSGVGARVKTLLHTGMAHTWRQWKEHAAVAGTSLERFLDRYL
ncbi:MAG: hypothetical protein JXP48_00130 [Acidobacteria bacterium]|nr:hypothetical protein [Acidobacteriota bacterium]